MEKIKRFSKSKFYDIIFFDKEDNCCGKIENTTNISNLYDVCNLAYDACSKIPYRVIVTNHDGSESGRWSTSLNCFNREF
jgi:hypothetical protein